MKGVRHDAHHGVRHAHEANLPSEDKRVRTKVVMPEFRAEEYHWRGTGLVILAIEWPTCSWVDAQHVQHIGRNRHPANFLATLGRANYRIVPIANAHDVRQLMSPSAYLSIGGHVYRIPRGTLNELYKGETICIAKWQRSEQYAVN